MSKNMYAGTWEMRTGHAAQSIPDVSIKNFHLSSAMCGLYDKPSPFPYFEYKKHKGGFSPRRWLYRWFVILRQIHRFKVQFDWNAKTPLFPQLVEYFPDIDNPRDPLGTGLTPFYHSYQGKKFNGVFYKCAEQLLNIEAAVPSTHRQHVCEIGGGFGGMAEMVIKRFQPEVYYIVDLPETLQVSALYLNHVFPGQVFFYRPGESLPKAQSGTTIILINTLEVSDLPSVIPEAELLINGNSFAEMDYSVVEQYFSFIESYPDCYLSNTNPPRWEGEYLYAGPETYPYSEGWEFVTKKRAQIYYFRKNYQMIGHWIKSD